VSSSLRQQEKPSKKVRIQSILRGFRGGLIVCLTGGMLFQGVGCLGALVPAAISLAESNLITQVLQFLTGAIL
jgi:hypothetical protein